MLLRLLLFLVIFNLISSGHSYTLWDWQDRQRRRVERQSKRLLLSDHLQNKEFSKPKHRVESDDNSNNEIEDKPDQPTLNVSSKDSPYALIDRFFPEREYNHEFMERNFQEKLKNGSFDDVDLGNLKPNEVWLSDGDLLVLKGGDNFSNRKTFDNPWKPLDDYVAPYRVPKLPPPDFIPSDTGVGVALPPEEEDEITAPVQPSAVAPVSSEKVANIKKTTKRDPFKTFLFDEEKFISQMENFHSKRRDELLNSIEMPRLQINLLDSPTPAHPTPGFTTPAKYNTTPRFTTPTKYNTTPTWFTPTPTPSIIRSTTTTALPSTTASSAGFYVSTSTPSSYSYAYQHEAQPVHENAKLVSSIARSTTTQSTTTITTTQKPTLVVRQLHPRNPKSYFIKPSNFFGQKVAPPPGSLLSNEIDLDNKVAEERHDHYYAKHPPPRPHWKKPPARARRKSFFSSGGPTLASTVISSLKPRYYRPFAPRRPPILPTPSTRRISTAGDHRYVSFYRGQIGGQSWGYSYHL